MKRKSMIAGLLIFILIVNQWFPSVANASILGNNPSQDITRESVETFITDFYKDWSDRKVTASVASFVKDGEVLYQKGFGAEDLESNNPVSPKDTLFRIGSINKSYTAMGIMQLVEEGKVDLDTDVNTYLKKIEVPNTFEKPITLRNLLTHTAGFDDKVIGMEAENYQDAKSLKEYLSKNLPKRIREPGQFVQYSNHSYALAGAVIEDVSGMSYEDYVTENILQPLEMNNSYPRIGLAPKDHLAKEYNWVDGKYKEAPLYDFSGVYPAGAMLATAEDMTHYMNVFLNGGMVGDQELLAKSSVETMHSAQFKSHPLQSGVGFGFFEVPHPSYQLTSHDGGVNSTFSQMILDHTRKFGVFFSATGPEALQMYAEFTETFYETFYPIPLQVSAMAKSYEGDQIEKFEGEYMDTRASLHDFGKITRLMNPTVKIKVADENTIQLIDAEGITNYVRIDELAFEDPETQNVLAFRVTEDGDVTHAMFSGSTLEKASMVQSPTTHIILFAIFIGWIVILFLVWFIGLIRDLLKKRWSGRSLLWNLTGGILGLQILFLIVFAVFVMNLENLYNLMFGLPGYYSASMILPYVAVVLSLFLGYVAVRSVGKKGKLVVGVSLITSIFSLGLTILLSFYQII